MMTELPMVCTCGLEGFVGAETRRVRIFNRMGLTNPAELTTAIILSLAFDFGAEVDVAADMWFDVVVLTDKGAVFVQCDHPGDGLAAAWECLTTASGAIQICSPQEENRLLSNLRAEWSAKSAHQDTHFYKKYDTTCPECRAHTHKIVGAQICLERFWGSDVMQPTIEKAFAQ